MVNPPKPKGVRPLERLGFAGQQVETARSWTVQEELVGAAMAEDAARAHVRAGAASEAASDTQPPACR